MKIALALTAATALAAAALVSPPVAAAPSDAQPAARALTKKVFTVFGTFTSRKQVTYGNEKGVGNLTITQGTIADLAGKNVGTLTTVIRVVAPSPKKDAEIRDTQSQIQLKDGQIFAQAVNEDPKEGPPKTLHIMPVTGGTGAYATARGTLIIYPMGNKYRMAYDIFVEKDLTTKTFRFNSISEAGASGSGEQGIGDVSMLHATGTDDSYVLIATRAGTAGKVVLDSVDLQVWDATGSLFARTISRSKPGAAQQVTFAVLGGTGAYAGYRGQLTYSADGTSVTAKLAPTPGKSKPFTWFEDGGRVVGNAQVTGGSFVGAEGYSFPTSNIKKKKNGDYFATVITYDPVGGVTPVVGMVEQEFTTGTMITTGITVAADPAAVRPIIGGTGDYGGAAGQATSTQQSGGVWRKTARFWR